MPIPSTIADLSTTAASNSPSGSDSPTQGDDFIRALSAIIAQEHADFASTSADKGADLVGLSLANHNNAGTLGGFLQYTFGRTAGEIAGSVTPTNYAYLPGMPERYGAVGDNSTDDLTAFNSMIAATPDGGTMQLFPGKTYRLSAVWTWGTTRSRVTLQGNGSTIRADHTGHGVDITGQNESYTGHSLVNVVIQGPNVSYPSSAGELAGTSTGAGILMGDSSDTTNSPSAYGNQFINVTIQGFLYGRYMRAAMLCTMIGGSIRYNQYGDAWDGGQANGNVSVGVRIRENRRIGVTSIGTTGGSLTNATANKYIGCIFETNIPYRSDNPAGFSGGYPTAMDTSGTLGVAVYLYNSYDFSFSDNYYENHNYSMVIDGSSDHTTFSNERLDGGGNRIGGVKLMGAGALYTKFIACHKNCTSGTEANIESDHADHAASQFLDCSGFNLVSGSLTGVPYVRNMTLSQAGGGTVIGDGNAPPQGRATDVQSGTAHGQIDTIGSATATLHCQGYQTIVCNTAVAAAGTNTTITAIDPGVQRDFVVKILNIQATRTVTIKNNSTIKTKSGADVALTASIGVITLWVAPSGTTYEI